MDTTITFRSRITGYLLLAVLKVASRLSLNTLRRLSKPIGWIYWILSPFARRTILGNLEICFPELSEAKRLRIGRESLCGTLLSFLESGKLMFGEHDATCSIEGLEHLLEAKARGKGVLLLGLHYTDADGAVFVLNRHVPVGAMYLRFRNQILEMAIREGRARHLKMIERSNIFGIVSALRNGEIIWFAPDQSYRDKRQVFAPFFGVPVPTLTSLTRFVRALDVAVVPFSHQRVGNTFQIAFAPRLEGLGEDELADAIRINRLTETAIRKRPQAYIWINWQLRYWRNRSAEASVEGDHEAACGECASTTTEDHSSFPHAGASQGTAE
jgi:KDO2-lipid IV(A) lauroyltransferase